MNQIHDQIYQGDLMSLNKAPKTEVTAIVNLASETPKNFGRIEKMQNQYLQIPITDGHANQNTVEITLSVIRHLVVEKDETVLINCAAGQSRSVLMAAAAKYFLQEEDLNYEQTLEQVRNELPQATHPVPELKQQVTQTINKM